jgi:hypothetical protein
VDRKQVKGEDDYDNFSMLATVEIRERSVLWAPNLSGAQNAMLEAV